MSSNIDKKRILILSQYYYPDITACAFRIHETAKLLTMMGCEVHVIAAEPHKGILSNTVVEDGKISVSRVRCDKLAKKGKWNYINQYLSFVWGALKAVPRHRGKFDLIWVTSPPLFTAIAGYLIAKVRKIKFCLDIRDIWPDSAVVAGQITKSGWMYKCAKITEKLLYKSSDCISCVAKPMANYISEIADIKEPLVIYNAVESSSLGERPEPLKLDSDICTILYLGNMGFCQNLSLIIEAAQLLKNKDYKGIKFVLVGEGIEKPMLQSKIDSLKLENVELRTLVSKHEALRLIKTSNALVLHLKDDGIMDKTIPSKVFDYMSGGRPILYGLKGEAKEILSSVAANLYYDPDSPQELADKVLQLRANYDFFAKSAIKNYDLLKDNYTREKMTSRLYEAFIKGKCLL